MGLWDRITAITRRLFTRTPTAVTPEDHIAWISEQVKEYTVAQWYASPQSSGLNFTGETWEMRRAYREFAFKEPAVKAPLLKKLLAVCALDVSVMPEDKNSPADKKAAAFLDYSVRTAKGGWPGTLWNMLVMSQVDGFSLCEKVLGVHERGQYEGRWTLKELVPKDTEYIRFRLDEFRRVQSVRPVAHGQGGQEFNPADFVLYTHLPLFRSPFGISDMRAVNRAANLIAASIKLRAMLLENFSGPFLKYKRKDASKVEQAKKTLSKARAMGYIVIDAGDELDVINLATSAPDQFQSTIEDLRKECSAGIAGSYLHLTESKTPQGDTSEHTDVSELFEWWLAETAGTTVTEQLSDDLIVPNFGKQVGRPTVKLGAIDIGALLREAQVMEAAQAIGIELGAEWAMEKLNVEGPRRPGDVLRPAKPMPFGSAGDPTKQDDPNAEPKLSSGADKGGDA